MTNEAAHARFQDSAKLLGLMSEYAEKLRSLCDIYLDARRRKLQTSLFAILLGLALLITLIVFLDKSQLVERTPMNTYYALTGSIVGSSIGIIGILFIQGTSMRHLYDVHQVALTVEKLLATASQYSEHSTRSISDKFEFDIRLAEAEASLRLYYSIFNRPTVASGLAEIVGKSFLQHGVRIGSGRSNRSIY